MAKIGVRAFNVRNAGIYYFEVIDGSNTNILTVVATSAQKVELKISTSYKYLMIKTYFLPK